MGALEDAARDGVEPLVAVAMTVAPADRTSYELDDMHETVRDHMALIVAAARYAVESKHHQHGGRCTCGFESARARSHTEHVMTEFFDELGVAAHAVRKEQDRG